MPYASTESVFKNGHGRSFSAMGLTPHRSQLRKLGFGERFKKIEGAPIRNPLTVAPNAEDQQFIALLNAFRDSGGLLMGEELMQHLGLDKNTGLAAIARKIASNELLSFTWNDSLWIPAFQIDRATMGVAEGMRRVRLELDGVLDGWGLAGWFCDSNAWLGGATPLGLFDSRLEDVIDAARADRFIALG